MRSGFWGSYGAGLGAFHCTGCRRTESSMAWNLAFGGAVRHNMFLGAELNYWFKDLRRGLTTRSVDFSTWTIAAYVFPYANGVHVKAGIGSAEIHFPPDPVTGELSEHLRHGTGIVLGVGRDVRLFGNVALTPSAAVFAARYKSARAHVISLTLGLTLL